MDRKTVKINTVSGGRDVTSFSQFEMFGQMFHVTISMDNENLFTVTHEGTGFCIDLNSETIEDAKEDGINFLKKKGKEKLYKTIRQSKWFLWKQKNVPKIKHLKWIVVWMYYIIVTIMSIIGAATIGTYLSGNLTITF